MKQADHKKTCLILNYDSKINTFSQRKEISLELQNVYVYAPGTLDDGLCNNNNNSNNIKTILNIIDYLFVSSFVICGTMNHEGIL